MFKTSFFLTLLFNSFATYAADISCFDFHGVDIIPEQTLKIINYKCDMKDIIVPSKINGSSIVEVDDDVFSGLELTSLVLPSSVHTIGSSAFSNNLLTTLNIPDSVVIIGPYAFRDNNLSYLKLPSSIDHVFPFAFYNNKLEKLALPDSIEQIGAGAFEKNPIKEVSINSNVSISKYSFGETNGFYKAYQESGRLRGLYKLIDGHWKRFER